MAVLFVTSASTDQRGNTLTAGVQALEGLGVVPARIAAHAQVGLEAAACQVPRDGGGRPQGRPNPRPALLAEIA